MRLNHQTLAIALLAAMCTAAPAQIQDRRTPAQRLEGFDLDGLKKRTPDQRQEIRDAINIDQNVRAFLYFALPPKTIQGAFKDFLRTIESARVDQQLGANPSAGAATSTVVKAGETALVSLAFETGALTQTVDQNVATLHANGEGLFRFLTNQEVIPICPAGNARCKPTWAKNLDLSASFNISGEDTRTLSGETAATKAPVSISALLNKHQFASASIQYAVRNPRDLRSKGYRDSFLKWFKTNQPALKAAGQDLLKAADDLLLSFQQTRVPPPPGTTPDPSAPVRTVYSEWLLATITRVANSLRTNSTESLETAYAAQLDDLIKKMREADSSFDVKLQGLFDAYTKYFSTQDQLGRNMITAPQWLIHATYSEPMLQPKVINVRFSYAWSPGTPSDSEKCTADLNQSETKDCSNPGTLTINGGVDLYQKAQPTGKDTNTSNFKDAQIALQFDRPLGAGNSPAQLSIGAYYQYQRNKGVFTVPTGATTIPGTIIPLPPTGATVLTDTQGSLYAVQGVVTLQIPGSGVRVPIGISWSNKTELVHGNEVRAHVGLSFNSVAALLGAK